MNTIFCDTETEKQTLAFILIQDGRILDVSASPVNLGYAFAARQADIFVAVGLVNEWGYKEITGVVGHYIYTPFAREWILIIDGGIPTKIQITGDPGKVLRDCLYELKRQGRMADPLNFGRVILAAQA